MIRARLALRNTLPSRHSRPVLVAITARERNPGADSALPTISSERPKPYAGAVSMSVMPRSRAARIVQMDSITSLPPHFQPPMAHVPSAMREISMPVPGIAANSMLRSRNLALLPMSDALLSGAVVVILVAHALLDVTLPCGLGTAGLRTVPGPEVGLRLVALTAGRLAERGGTEKNRQQKRTHGGMLTRAHGTRVSRVRQGG